LRAKTKTKAMWQIINTESGNSTHHDYKIDLRNGNEFISNLQNVLDRLNSFYVETVDNLLNLNNNCINVHTSQQKNRLLSKHHVLFILSLNMTWGV